MAHSLQSFARQCHGILASRDNPSGRAEVAQALRDALRDEAFVESLFPPDAPERRVAYEDPELRFCIVAHDYQGAKDTPPHDHGPSWAIYGQARGTTRMSDWALVEPATPERAGLVRKLRDYELMPGDAHVYNEGDLHSPSRSGPTRLVRIEGVNMDTVKRLKFKAMEITFSDNRSSSRFELRQGMEVAAHADYRLAAGVMTLVHTEVAKAFEGQGLGSKIARGALDSARQQGLKVDPQCEFMAGYIAKHPEYQDLLVNRT
jgi:predicted GNAT family acetyltransferase